MKTILYLFCLLLFSSCVATKYNPAKKYSPAALQSDYKLFREILEDAHPSLYWYTPKDSMDFFFAKGSEMLQDSLTEPKFRAALAYVIAKIKCGHTSVRASKAASRYNSLRDSSFPLFVKIWPDTAVVTMNLNRRDSDVSRGVILKSIENRPMDFVVDSLFTYLSADGNNTTHKYQTLSNGSNFRSMYAVVFGVNSQTKVTYIDSTERLKTSSITLFKPAPDSLRSFNMPKLSRSQRKKLQRESVRNLKVDSTLNTAFMEVNSFTKGNGLRKFFRRSFRSLQNDDIANLVVDMRGNGGGSVVLSNLLTKYIANKPFKIADSLYAIKRSSRYGKYQEHRLINWLFLVFFTRKKSDHNYHFAFFENKYFKPKRKHHFSGTTYILTGGNTFSAASLFTKSLIKQDDVIVVGEETGGGAYGNTAWLIPDVTLPNTGVRFRLPLFRMIIDKDAQKGRGVMPEVEVLPTVNSIRSGVDFKMEKVKEMIRNNERSLPH